jgi:acetamidase/formamidase
MIAAIVVDLPLPVGAGHQHQALLQIGEPREDRRRAQVLEREDLNKAFVNAGAETVDFLVAHKGLERSEADSLAAVAADCRVSQYVDVRKGVHCMVPKAR